jgi:hypothetical protein
MAIYKNTPPVVTNGLVLYWDGANTQSYTSGSLNWNDISKNGYNGLLIGSSSFSSFGGGSYQSGHPTARITSSLQTLPSSSTFEFWINRYINANTYNMIGGMYLPYFSFFTNGTLLFSNRIGGAQQNTVTTSTFQNNTWYQVAFITEYTSSNNTTTANIYVNGTLSRSVNYSGSQQSPSDQKFTVGSWQSNITEFPLSGSIALTKVYNRALSAQEVLQNYNALKGRFGL